MAWWFQWETRDLVWSLWLSSLVVGYAMIVWTIFGPALFVGTRAWGDRALLEGTAKGPLAVGGALFLVGGLFLLAFFTFHFGMFHFVHSVFLNMFFPVLPGGKMELNPTLYGTVLATYWPFVLVAAVAERKAFRWGPAEDKAAGPDASVKAADIAARKQRNAGAGGMKGMMAPYKNVVRMHVLIFFFAFTSFMKIENFAVYAVVYAVYFFPWGLLRSEQPPAGRMDGAGM